MYNSTNTISTINVHEASTFLRRKKVACLKQYDKTHCIHHCSAEGGGGLRVWKKHIELIRYKD